jgi:hypothetical protein
MLKESLTNLNNTIPPEKIFYLQISDCSRKVSPEQVVSEAKKQGISPLYAISNSWRPLPFMGDAVAARRAEGGSSESSALAVGTGEVEGGFQGFFPVVDVVQAVLATGWCGPWSYEVFYEESMARDDVGIPRFWARAAKKSHQLLIAELEKKL